ncbi:MAG: NfeD family protein [Duodenibacillus sp.]|nr:NfeD family protein [Duodenibacillus sp.]
MLLTPQWMWLIAGLILCGAEMLVGTFYLLVLGAACLAAAGCAWLGLVVGWQCLAFAAVAVIGGLVVRHLRGQQNDESHAIQNLDVGQSVRVQAWNEDGTALVQYRGTQWTAVADEGVATTVGVYRIVRVEGSRLVLTNN